MIRICICDDDKLFTERCVSEIKELAKKEHKSIEIRHFSNGESLLFELEEKYNLFDIIIMDMFMKELNGIETTKQLRKGGFIGEIIFLSSSREYALEAFEVEPRYYVLKEANYESKFKEVLLRSITQIECNYDKKLIIETKQKKIALYLNDILYIECIDKKIFIHRVSGEVELCNITLSTIEQKTSKYGLIRCHKSFIVNCDYVEYFSKSQCTLAKNVTIPIGRKYATTFQTELTKYQMNDIIL